MNRAVPTNPYSSEVANLFELVETGLPAAAESARFALAGLRVVFEVLRKENTIDQDTQLPNRRAMGVKDYLARLNPLNVNERKRNIAQRHERPIAGHFVEFIDLDRFKHINDFLGHDEGDRVIAMVATTICMSVRDYDELYRFGGDEFMVFAPQVGSGYPGFSYSEILSRRMHRSIDALKQPGMEEYLPPYILNSTEPYITPIDLEALDIVGWTIGEQYVEGPTLDRCAVAAIADEDMRARKGVGRN